MSGATLRKFVDGVGAYGARTTRCDGNPRRTQCTGEWLEHCVRTSQDCKRWVDPGLHVRCDDVSQQVVLVVFVLNLEILHRETGRTSRVHVCSGAVVRCHVRGHREYLRSTAIVAGQREHGWPVECVGQAGEECGVGAIPAVDGLEWVTNDEDIVSPAAKSFEKGVLQWVHVLGFIHENVTEAKTRGCGKVDSFVDGSSGVTDEVVEVDQPTLGLQLFVRAIRGCHARRCNGNLATGTFDFGFVTFG